MTTEEMVIDAQKRVKSFVNRSAAQHSNAIERNFESSEFWTVESMEAAAACNQIEIDKLGVLYDIGCKYGISMDDSRRLCDVAGISFHKLMHSKG